MGIENCALSGRIGIGAWHHRIPTPNASHRKATVHSRLGLGWDQPNTIP